MSSADPRSMFTVRFIDRNGQTKERHFTTNARLVAWLDRARESGQVSEVLAYADPS